MQIPILRDTVTVCCITRKDSILVNPWPRAILRTDYFCVRGESHEDCSVRSVGSGSGRLLRLALRWLGVKNRRLCGALLMDGVCCGADSFFFSEINIGRIISLAVLGVLTALAAVDRDRPIASLDCLGHRCGLRRYDSDRGGRSLGPGYIFHAVSRDAGGCIWQGHVFCCGRWRKIFRERSGRSICRKPMIRKYRRSMVPRTTADGWNWLCFLRPMASAADCRSSGRSRRFHCCFWKFFAFFAGLELIGLLFSNQRERKQALTERNSIRMTCRPT